jgi:hypothetical protein
MASPCLIAGRGSLGQNTNRAKAKLKLASELTWLNQTFASNTCKSRISTSRLASTMGKEEKAAASGSKQQKQQN